MRRVRHEEDRVDAREARQYRRTQQEQIEQRRIVPMQKRIEQLEDLSIAAARYHSLLVELGNETEETVSARLEFLNASSIGYLYPDIVEKLLPFTAFPEDTSTIQELLEYIGDEIEGYRSRLTTHSAPAEPEVRTEAQDEREDSLLVSLIRRAEEWLGLHRKD